MHPRPMNIRNDADVLLHTQTHIHTRTHTHTATQTTNTQAPEISGPMWWVYASPSGVVDMRCEQTCALACTSVTKSFAGRCVLCPFPRTRLPDQRRANYYTHHAARSVRARGCEKEKLSSSSRVIWVQLR